MFDNVRLDATEVTAPPSPPTNLAATAGDSQVALTWTVSSGATGYSVKRWTTSAPLHVEIGTPSGTSYTDTTAANGTTYYYVVAATNGLGTSADSGEVSATPILSTPIDLRVVAATAVTASNSYPDFLPEYVSDWSGMTGTFPDGLDGIDALQWSSDGNQDPSLDWIAWDLGATYTLAKVHVWNDNAYANGIKTVDIEVSSDGINWTKTAYTGLSWPDAPGTADYAGFDQVFNTPITTRYIRFANLVSHGGYDPNYVALDEVVFYSTPPPAMTPIDLRSVATTAVTASSNYTDPETTEVYRPEYVSDWSDMTGTFPDGLDGTNYLQWSSDGNQDPSLDWIAWDLGASYTLGKVHVWNDNAYANGIKTVDIEVSSDGINWTKTAYTGLSWPDAPGTADYAGFDQVFSTPITTRYIRFANLVSYGGYDPNYVALDEVVFYSMATPPSDPFTSWITGLDWTGFISPDLSPAGDPDGDGLTNQQEFAFGLDPTTGASVNPCTPLRGTQFSYTRRATSGLSYTVEYSTDLTNWNPATVSESAGAADSNGVQTVTVTVSNPALNGKLFVRVQAR